MSDTHIKHHVHETAPMHDPTDAWHDHAADEKPQHAHSDVQNTPLIMGVGVALFMIILFSVAAVYGFYTWYVARALNQQEVTTAGAPALKFREEKAGALTLVHDGGTLELAPLEEGKPKRQITIIAHDKATATVIQQYAPKLGAAGSTPTPDKD